jgi:hypothetical protein
MKSSDIITQLATKLPALVNNFTTSFSVDSLTLSGTTVTATTSSAHGLAVGKAVIITGAQTTIDIGTLTRSGIVGTLVTDADHDMTEGVFTEVEIDGASESEFNGTFTLSSVKNRRTVTFIMPDSGATTATGSPLLLNGASALQSYNGLVEVDTVPTTTTFTYEITDSTLNTPADGTIVVQINPRISGAATDERAAESYTKQSTDEAWLYVVLNDMVASKNRNLLIDGTDNIQRTNHFKQYASQTVSLYLFVPTTSEISGRLARDTAEEMLQPICQSILFTKFDSLLSEGEYNALMFNEHGFHDYNRAYYMHRYTFELSVLFTFDDTVGADEDVAFRDISLTQLLDVGNGVQEMTAEIDLDDEDL